MKNSTTLFISCSAPTYSYRANNSETVSILNNAPVNLAKCTHIHLPTRAQSNGLWALTFVGSGTWYYTDEKVREMDYNKFLRDYTVSL